MRSRSGASGAAGPQTTTSASGLNIGAKNISPWMWSRCRWVSRMWIGPVGLGHAQPERAGCPVPASSTSVEPSDETRPARTTCCRRSAPSPRPASGWNRGRPRRARFTDRPEHHHRPPVAVRTDDRDAARLDLRRRAVGGADAEARVARTVAHQGLGEVELVEGDRLVLVVERAVLRRPLLDLHRPRVLEAAAQQRARRPRCRRRSRPSRRPGTRASTGSPAGCGQG